MTNYIKYFSYAVVGVVSFLLGYFCYSYTHQTTSTTITTNNDHPTTAINSDTTVTVTPKTTEDDLIVENKYIAKVNGETLEVPIKTTTLNDSKEVTATVSSTIDLTPVVKKMADNEYKRNWEVSTGFGKTHDGDFYVPIGIQRNFNYNRAIEVSVGLSKDHIENIQVTHKWKF